jgi:hypothetical protein
LKLPEIGALFPLTPGRKRTDRVALSKYIDLKLLSQTQILKTMKIGSLPPLPEGEGTDRVALSKYIDLKFLSRTQILKPLKIGSLPPLPLGGEGWGEGDRFH